MQVPCPYSWFLLLDQSQRIHTTNMSLKRSQKFSLHKPVHLPKPLDFGHTSSLLATVYIRIIILHLKLAKSNSKEPVAGQLCTSLHFLSTLVVLVRLCVMAWLTDLMGNYSFYLCNKQSTGKRGRKAQATKSLCRNNNKFTSLEVSLISFDH